MPTTVAHNPEDSVISNVPTTAEWAKIRTGANRSNAKTKEFASRTKALLDKTPVSDLSPEEYANVLLHSCGSKGSDDEKAASFELVLASLFRFERMAFSVSDSKRLEFFRRTKRAMASKVLENALKTLERSGFHGEEVRRWENWILFKSVSDMADFSFWDEWRSRLELERDVFTCRNDDIDFVL
jgi:hypothetical protein